MPPPLLTPFGAPAPIESEPADRRARRITAESEIVRATPSFRAMFVHQEVKRCEARGCLFVLLAPMAQQSAREHALAPFRTA